MRWLRHFVIATLALLAIGNPVPMSAHEVAGKVTERRETQIAIADFSLVDQDGRPVQFAKLAGRVVIIAFAYTTCPDVCPLITAALRQVQEELTVAERHKVSLLTITTDPEIDSPKVLSGYAKRHGADLANWAFLTGDEATLRKVWKNFGVGVKRKGRGLVDHTPLVAVVDGKGHMRVAYVGPMPDARAVLKDLRRLLKSS
jgi:protein SCO1/2